VGICLERGQTVSCCAAPVVLDGHASFSWFEMNRLDRERRPSRIESFRWAIPIHDHCGVHYNSEALILPLWARARNRTLLPATDDEFYMPLCELKHKRSRPVEAVSLAEDR
jgi:hypothetical protein